MTPLQQQHLCVVLHFCTSARSQQDQESVVASSISLSVIFAAVVIVKKLLVRHLSAISSQCHGLSLQYVACVKQHVFHSWLLRSSCRRCKRDGTLCGAESCQHSPIFLSTVSPFLHDHYQFASTIGARAAVLSLLDTITDRQAPLQHLPTVQNVSTQEKLLSSSYGRDHALIFALGDSPFLTHDPLLG